MADLVTLGELKDHLRITSDQQNADLDLKLRAAQAIVIDYLSRRDTTWNATMTAWTADTVPLTVKAAIFVQCGELYRVRGDDAQQDAPGADGGQLSPTVMALLRRYRDPALA